MNNPDHDNHLNLYRFFLLLIVDYIYFSTVVFLFTTLFPLFSTTKPKNFFLFHTFSLPQYIFNLSSLPLYQYLSPTTSKSSFPSSILSFNFICIKKAPNNFIGTCLINSDLDIVLLPHKQFCSVHQYEKWQYSYQSITDDSLLQHIYPHFALGETVEKSLNLK